jgi:hypothetical protein
MLPMRPAFKLARVTALTEACGLAGRWRMLTHFTAVKRLRAQTSRAQRVNAKKTGLCQETVRIVATLARLTAIMTGVTASKARNCCARTAPVSIWGPKSRNAAALKFATIFLIAGTAPRQSEMLS